MRRPVVGGLTISARLAVAVIAAAGVLIPSAADARGTPSSAAAAPAAAAATCESSSFAGLAVAGAKTSGVRVVHNAGGSAILTPSVGRPAVLPAVPFCEVEVTVTHGSPHVDQLPADNEHVWIWLPDAWNGRFEAVGGGGWRASLGAGEMAPPLGKGYAVASSDAGLPVAETAAHPMLVDGRFDWQLFENFAYRSIHETALIAKSAIGTYYGGAPDYSYWSGCSNGGRQGLMAAQRFPTDFNGILAESPALYGPGPLNMSDAQPSILENQSFGQLMPPCKFRAMNQAVVAACDGLDGLADGLISNPPACNYRGALQQLVGTTTSCGPITEQDVDVAIAIMDGPRTWQGDFLWYGWPAGVDLSTGVAEFMDGSALATFAARDPSFDWTTVSVKDLVTNLYRKMNQGRLQVLETADPNLAAFAAAGGKVIMWHGWADAIVPVEQSIRYYNEVTGVSGAETPSFARLFLAPGVNHCGGGYGPAPADPFSSLVSWVEHGSAPDMLPAVQRNAAGQVTRSRPLCTYPAVAIYNGTGDPNVAASFTCRAPTP
jgi:hypothetical protein